MSVPINIENRIENDYKLFKLRRFSLVIGYFLVLSLIYICLIPNPPDTSGISFGDKIAHLSGYALLFLWFSQIYQRKAQLKVVYLLVLLGIIIEIAQGMSGYRMFEYADMLANTSGVVLGWLIAATPVSSLVLLLEKQLEK